MACRRRGFNCLSPFGVGVSREPDEQYAELSRTVPTGLTCGSTIQSAICVGGLVVPNPELLGSNCLTTDLCA
jgi:hypothetical protein